MKDIEKYYYYESYSAYSSSISRYTYFVPPLHQPTSQLEFAEEGERDRYLLVQGNTEIQLGIPCFLLQLSSPLSETLKVS